MIFYTADLHFNHTNIIKYENRPFNSVEEMNEALILNWNSKVTKSDQVFILGDFGFGNTELLMEIIIRLNGMKHLIRGNHDYFVDNKKFDPSLFQWVKDFYYHKTGKGNFFLCHYPMLSWQCKEHGAFLLHGHTHTKPMEFDSPFILNVGVDKHNFFPLSTTEVLSALAAKNNGNLIAPSSQ